MFLKKSFYAGLMLCVAMLSGCSGVETPPVPVNEINSSAGIKVELEWTTGGTSSDAISDADLDLYLMKGTTEAGKSINYSRFEAMTLSDLFADGEYTVQVKADYVGKKNNYTLYVKGDDTGELKSYKGEFLQGDSNLKVDFLKIKKAGTKYTITEY